MGRAIRVTVAQRKAAFVAWLRNRFFLRFHMAVMLGLAFAAGLGVTRLFVMAGDTNLALRYGVAVAVSYAAFMVLLRLWLWYLAQADEGDDGISLLDVGDGVDLAGQAVRSTQPALAGFEGEGGSFGGGGASGSFGGSAAEGVADLAAADEGGCAVAVVLAIAALVLTVLLAGLYLVYAAPAILAEAAFQALLAPALLPAARRVEAEGWVPATVRATALPFACMFIAAVGFGWAAKELCPDARRMVEVVACARR